MGERHRGMEKCLVGRQAISYKVPPGNKTSACLAPCGVIMPIYIHPPALIQSSPNQTNHHLMTL